MGRKDPLDEYKKKRDLRKTSEPAGKKKKRSEQPIFVIQKHAATRLHYDFRIEVDGVLKSWAIPKGPSLIPKEKRLAVPTEDHPMDYADFEGVIPEEEYGGGTVMVWDRGTYRNMKEERGEPVPMSKALEHGHATIWLDGKKLRGGYALTRFRKGKDESWLLVKMNDEHADVEGDVTVDRPESVISGKRIEEIGGNRHE
ncbi:MAG: DNA ligase [Candidatus Abyssobacteria bacterium SURF_5]|uniref:DNA ligase n=1 Tax=Abyssobacteria bacterium (strain SURF_5) TaxID=2093360 RepID=A0A3A4NKR7_ABYX5|nr:MAG: DNA ligase [Candidatus Abyssubacteria bacterium SURF_5]